MLQRAWFGLFLLAGLFPVGARGQEPDPEPPRSLAGTVWSAVESDGCHYTFRFLKGGVLCYTSSAGTYRDASWQQTGATVYFEINGKYSERKGTIKGKQMEGTGWNRDNLKWTWKAKKVVGR